MGNRPAVWAAFLGALAALTMPVAIGATRYSAAYSLLHAGFAIPVAAGLGITAVFLSRRAKTLERLTLGRARGARAGRVGRLLGILAICMAASAAIAVAVYELLVSVQ